MVPDFNYDGGVLPPRGKMWPGIALACSFGNIFASWMLFSWASLNITYTAINIIEATVGALLLRKLLLV